MANVDPRQREEWEKKRKLALCAFNNRIQILELAIDEVIKERDEVESMTFEDDYFQFLSEKEEL